MNKDQFLDYIQQPKQELRANKLSQLEELTKKYPYFNSAHFLVAQSKRDEKTKKQASLYARKRGLLRELLDLNKTIAPIVKKAVIEKPKTETASSTSENVSKDEQTELQPTPKTPSIKPSATTLIEKSQPAKKGTTKSEDAKPQDSNADNAIQEKGLKNSTQVADELAQRLQELQERKKMLRDLDIVSDEPAKEEKKPVRKPAAKRTAAKKADPPAKSSSKTTVTKRTGTSKKPSAAKSSTKEVANTVQKKTSTTAKKPIRKTSNTTKPTKKPSETAEDNKAVNHSKVEITKVDETIFNPPQEKYAYSFSDTMIDYLEEMKLKGAKPKKNIKSKKVEKSGENDVIDQFIKTNPEITRLSEIELNEKAQQDLAKKSGVENPTLVSENLAKINVQQGNLKKAKQIYKQLQLKYPEKKAYFADQIKKLSK